MDLDIYRDGYRRSPNPMAVLAVGLGIILAAALLSLGGGCQGGTPTKCGYYDQGCINQLQEVVDECNDAGWCADAGVQPLCEPVGDGTSWCNPIICEVYHDYTSETAYINFCVSYPGS